MINETFHVTFGVEFEAVLAFHEDLLKKHLNTIGNNSTIKKDIPEDIRRDLKQVHSRYAEDRPKYMGWGLTAPTTYTGVNPRRKGQDFFQAHLEKYTYRGYAGEIMTLAQSLLPANVRANDDADPQDGNYLSWYLTHDTSLVGASEEELATHLQHSGRNILPTELKNWNSHPIELVTRVLPFVPSSFDEIGRHLAPLHSKPEEQYTTLVSGYCGLHVHVGVPVPENHIVGAAPPTFELPTLQHLAYILVMYEKSLNMLFPKSRRVGNTAADLDLQTNLGSFFPEPEEYTEEQWAAYFAQQGLENAGAEAGASSSETNDNDDPAPPESDSPPSCPTEPFSAIRAKIFAKDQAIPDLGELIGGLDKHHIVNWQNVRTLSKSIQTIEFRQHEGTLDPVAVKHWVTFVVGLVRLAQEMGRVHGVGNFDEEGTWVTYEGEGYPYQEWSEGMSVGDLMKLMGMEEEEKAYFERRLEEFA